MKHVILAFLNVSVTCYKTCLLCVGGHIKYRIPLKAFDFVDKIAIYNHLLSRKGHIQSCQVPQICRNSYKVHPHIGMFSLL